MVHLGAINASFGYLISKFIFELYFRNKELRHLKVHDELKGIGVRIEDDILITEKLSLRNDGKTGKELSCEVLSSGCPKTISDLESLPL